MKIVDPDTIREIKIASISDNIKLWETSLRVMREVTSERCNLLFYYDCGVIRMGHTRNGTTYKIVLHTQEPHLLFAEVRVVLEERFFVIQRTDHELVVQVVSLRDCQLLVQRRLKQLQEELSCYEVVNT